MMLTVSLTFGKNRMKRKAENQASSPITKAARPATSAKSDLNTLLTTVDELLVLDDHDEALKLCNQILSQDSKCLAAYFKKAEILLIMNKGFDAELTYNRILLLNPENIEALYGRARALDLQKETNSCMEACERIISLDPQHLGALILRASLQFDDDEYDLAEADFQAVLKIAPTDIKALLLYAGFLEFLLRYEEAAAKYTAIFELNPQGMSVELYSMRADCYSAAENYAAAIADYSSLLDINPQDEDILRKRALCLAKTKNHEAALEDCIAVVNDYLLNYTQLSNNNEPFATPLEALEAVNQLTRAELIDDLDDEEYIEFNEFIAKAMCSSLFNLGHKDEAMAVINKILTEIPANETVLLIRANFSRFEDDCQTALNDYDTILSSIPDSEEALFGRMICLAYFNQLVALTETCRQIVNINLEWRWTLITHADAYFNIKKYAIAIAIYEGVLKACPLKLDILLSKAHAAYCLEDYELGQTDTKAYLSQDPDSLFAKLLLHLCEYNLQLCSLSIRDLLRGGLASIDVAFDRLNTDCEDDELEQAQAGIVADLCDTVDFLLYHRPDGAKQVLRYVYDNAKYLKVLEKPNNEKIAERYYAYIKAFYQEENRYYLFKNKNYIDITIVCANDNEPVASLHR
jgi:tetratricopeptide (TPR) repeat protein